MDVEKASSILECAGVSHGEFASMLGIKESSVRIYFCNGRFSKRAVERLNELARDSEIERDALSVDELIEEAKKESILVKEGIIKQTLAGGRIGEVYALVRNPYVRLVEFSDGSHGKFRAKPGRFGIGSKVRLELEGGDLWRVVGKYDRKDRMI
jgi:hypothetical protein